MKNRKSSGLFLGQIPVQQKDKNAYDGEINSLEDLKAVFDPKPSSRYEVSVKQLDLAKLGQVLVDVVDFGFPKNPDKPETTAEERLIALAEGLATGHGTALKDALSQNPSFVNHLRTNELNKRMKKLVYPIKIYELTKNKLAKEYINLHKPDVHNTAPEDYQTRLEEYAYNIYNHLGTLDKSHEFISANFNRIAKPPQELLAEGRAFRCPDKLGIAQAIKNHIDSKKNVSMADSANKRKLKREEDDLINALIEDKSEVPVLEQIVRRYQLDRQLLGSIDTNKELKTSSQKFEALLSYIENPEDKEIINDFFGGSESVKEALLVDFRSVILDRRIENMKFDTVKGSNRLEQDALKNAVRGFHTDYADNPETLPYNTRLAHFYYRIGEIINDKSQATRFIQANFDLLARDKTQESPDKKQKLVKAPDNKQISYFIENAVPPPGVNNELFKQMGTDFRTLKSSVGFKPDAATPAPATQTTVIVATEQPATQEPVEKITVAPAPSAAPAGPKKRGPKPGFKRKKITFFNNEEQPAASQKEETAPAKTDNAPVAEEPAAQEAEPAPAPVAVAPAPVAEKASVVAEAAENKADVTQLTPEAAQSIDLLVQNLGGVENAIAALKQMVETGLNATQVVAYHNLNAQFEQADPAVQALFLKTKTTQPG